MILWKLMDAMNSNYVMKNYWKPVNKCHSGLDKIMSLSEPKSKRWQKITYSNLRPSRCAAGKNNHKPSVKVCPHLFLSTNTFLWSTTTKSYDVTIDAFQLFAVKPIRFTPWVYRNETSDLSNNFWNCVFCHLTQSSQFSY